MEDIFMSNSLFEFGKASAETKITGPAGMDSPVFPRLEPLA
jgi:hypothetical protein